MSRLEREVTTERAEEVVPPLSAEEIRQLRRLMSVARYDPREGAFVIDTGRARVAVRDDGTIRAQGAGVTVLADGPIVMDAATIELN